MKLSLTFLQTRPFVEQIEELGAVEQLNQLISQLTLHPDMGKVIPGGEGLRKVRMALPGRGKRGGARAIYYHIVDMRTILFLDAYAKNEIEDLSGKQLKKLIQVKNEAVNAIRKSHHEKDN